MKLLSYKKLLKVTPKKLQSLINILEYFLDIKTKAISYDEGFTSHGANLLKSEISQEKEVPLLRQSESTKNFSESVKEVFKDSVTYFSPFCAISITVKEDKFNCAKPPKHQGDHVSFDRDGSIIWWDKKGLISAKAGLVEQDNTLKLDYCLAPYLQFDGKRGYCIAPKGHIDQCGSFCVDQIEETIMLMLLDKPINDGETVYETVSKMKAQIAQMKDE